MDKPRSKQHDEIYEKVLKIVTNINENNELYNTIVSSGELSEANEFKLMNVGENGKIIHYLTDKLTYKNGYDSYVSHFQKLYNLECQLAKYRYLTECEKLGNNYINKLKSYSFV